MINWSSEHNRNWSGNQNSKSDEKMGFLERRPPESSKKQQNFNKMKTTKI